MSTQALFDSAELSFAAYSTLSRGETRLQIAALLDRGNGMSLTQATEFAKRFPTVVTEFNDTPAEDGMGTSFSATVFKDSTGKLTLAIRGTRELFRTPSDLVPTDADIASSGAGYDQIAAMHPRLCTAMCQASPFAHQPPKDFRHVAQFSAPLA